MSKILREITAKENRKALRKAGIEALILFLAMVSGYMTALYLAIKIWSY